MNETQEQAINVCKELLQKLKDLKEVKDYDELRLVLIRLDLEKFIKQIDDFGKPFVERLKK